MPVLKHSTVMNLQPVLTPCKGTAVDLSVCIDPDNPDHLHLFWGTALLQVVPRDRNSLLFRVVAGLLTGLGLKMSSLEQCLGTSSKTLRKWSEALTDGHWDDVSAIFHGPGADVKLRPDIEQYVRQRYRELLEEAGDRPLHYGFREEIIAEVERYWNLEISGETLRRVFRKEDERRAAGNEPEPNACESVDAAPATENDSRAGDNAPERTDMHQSAGEAENDVALSAASAAGDDDICREKWEQGCASALTASADPSETRNLASVSAPEPCSTPILKESWPHGVQLSQHAGLFLLLPWFENTFRTAPEIVRQTAAQILLGAVNQEQSKKIDFPGLELFVHKPVCDITYQHTLLGEQLGGSILMEVFAWNAKLLNLKNQRNFYVDPHHKSYTGLENILRGWSGKFHDIRKGIMMDFIHSEDGSPCFIGHFDSYDDARARFIRLVERFRELFGGDVCGFVWINDRGYWSREFLLRISENGDNFIQWEKGYNDDGWDMPFVLQGRFTITRKRNNSSDHIKLRVRWREQSWSRIKGGRRFIVRIKRPDADAL